MGTLELKDILTKYISTADDRVLRIVKAVFESYQSDSSQENSESSVFEKLIEKGLEDSEAGRVRPHSAVMEDVRKRYNL